ncbi:MAG: amidohydrolase [Victivallaceae bacterium]|nr:amidohydrolase [Victivallaceae bacterium]
MICDAHVHVGYFPRKGFEKPVYYSPCRIFGILKRANVTEFIFSSTNAIWDFDGKVMHREAEEVIRLAGNRAHAFFWITDEYLKRDRNLEKLPDFYEGFKLHGGETPWLRHPNLLRRILSIARERRFPVQIHTGGDDDGEANPITAYLPFCRKFPSVKFDLAHGKPSAAVPDAVNHYDNVFVDCAYCHADVVRQWIDAGAREERILFGSDIPVQQRLFNVSLTNYLRRTLKGFASEKVLHRNFMEFLRTANRRE